MDMLDFAEWAVEQYPWAMGVNLYLPGNQPYNCIEDLPEGWRDLIADWLVDVQAYVDTLSEGSKEDFGVIQLKEKYGEFRQYFTFQDPKLTEIVHRYMDRSRSTCARCGRPAHLTCHGWILPLCDECEQQVIDREQAKE